MLLWRTFGAAFFLFLFNNTLFAKEFYLDSTRNKGIIRFEMDNDIVWNKDSNFSNGWSVQYHTVRYASWDETEQPGFIKWIGKHFPTLDRDDSIVRNSYGIGQNMITPGDISVSIPQERELPYAGTLTYSMSWQSFNRRTARNFQFTAGVLGRESFAKDLQKFVHNELGAGEDPKGWDTQRDTEPIINASYKYALRLVHMGEYHNGWAGQLSLEPSVSFGNLFSAAEVGIGLRFGWNIQEGFNTYPAPPGRGIFQASTLPKPASASPHGLEIIIGAIGTGLIYSVVYDGSFITGDDREVERKDFVVDRGIGIYYHYYNLFAIRASVQQSSALIKEESIPEPSPGKRKTSAENSFGSLIVDYYF